MILCYYTIYTSLFLDVKFIKRYKKMMYFDIKLVIIATKLEIIVLKPIIVIMTVIFIRIN